MLVPHQLVFETSGACQLRCPQCWKGLGRTNRNAFLSLELFNQVTNEAQAFIKHTYLHLWGEPTLNPHLPEMIRRTRQFSTVDIATHALALTEEMAEAIAECETISCSIDGVTQDVYERYRVGGQLAEAMRGMKLLREKAGKRINWTFVVFRHNEHQLADAQRIADELDLNIGFKPPCYWDMDAMADTMPTDESLRRFHSVNGVWELKADRLKCREFWETAYVLPTGDMITCCYDGAATNVVGNVRDGFVNVWNGPAYTALRQIHASGKLNPMCEAVCNLPA